MSSRDDEALTVRIPADVERPDEIMAGLSARQLALVAVVGIGLWLLYTVTAGVVPLVVFGVVAFPVTAFTAALVLVKRDGLGLDQLLLAALRQRLGPRRLAPSAGGQAEGLPEWVAADIGPLPAPLRLPAQAITRSGVIDLGRDGVALVCACSTVNFHLRTPGEQHALVSGFARWLNSLQGPVQVLVRADRIDLDPMVSALREDAPGLPDPALEAAAYEHAEFLAELADTRDLLRRLVLLVLREPAGQGGRQAAAHRVLRRAEEAARALAAAEVAVTVLDGVAAAAVLTAAADPAGTGTAYSPSAAPPGSVITGPDEWGST